MEPAERTDAQNAQQTQEDRIDAAERTQVINETLERERQTQIESNSGVLPDESGEEAALKTEFAKKEEGYKKKLNELEADRTNFDKRLRDTQHKLHMLTAEKAGEPKRETTAAKPEKTFDDYIKGIKEEFEADPASAVTKMVSDFVADRDMLRSQYQKDLAAMRDSILNEIMLENPDNAQLMAAVEELNVARPDLANLTTKQKLEFVKMMNVDTTGGGNGRRSPQDVVGDDAPPSRTLLAGVKRNAVKSNGLPSWLNDPEVQREASKLGFTSKKEILDWTNPEKARAMARKMVAAQQ